MWAGGQGVKILMLSEHCCIRVVKMSLALEAAGHGVVHMCRRVANPDMEPALNAVSKWRTRDDLKTKLAASAGAFDVIHVHNEPSELVTIARRSCPNAAIVFDCHDLDACRGNTCNVEEHIAFADCDAAIFPSAEYQRRAIAWFKLEKSTAVVPSMLPAGMIKQITPATRIGGLVYAGSTSYAQYGYTDYRGLANRMHEAGIPFTLVQASNENTLEYVEAGAHVLGPLPYMAMLGELTRYDYGLCAGGRPGDQWNRTIPNKLWEYLAAGIPVVCWGADATARVVREIGVGEVLDGADDLTPQRWAQMLSRRPMYAANVGNAAGRIAMDGMVATIIDTYNAAIARRSEPYRVAPFRAKPKLSFVTGTLNRKPHLIAMMQSIRCLVSLPYEIVVVDGGSTDGTEQYCREQSDVTFIQQGRKLGAVAAFNAGFRSASADIVVHLNDDCMLEGSPDRLIDIFSRNPKLAQLAFPWRDGSGHYGIQRTPPVGLNNRAIPYANFGAVRRVAGDAVGWWGNYKHYAGDCELTLRLRADGWETGVTEHVKVTHARLQDETRNNENADLLPFKRRWFLREVE